jgi:molybdate transport system substrate-binding protein
VRLKGIIAAAGNHLKIFSGGAMRPLIVDLVPLFERAHDAIVDVEFRLTSALKQAIEAGAIFDLVIMPRPDLDELIARGAVAPGTACDIAHSSVGLAVRTGAPKPDIGSVAALRQALLQARSLAYSDGPSGAYVAGLLTKLGIAEEVAPKSKLTGRPVAELVASGEAEVGMQQIVAILPVKGA